MFHLPQGCTLTIEGPQFVAIGLTGHYEQTQGYAPVPVPQPAPYPVPHRVPQATPAATPQATPTLNVPGFLPTYSGYQGYAPVTPEQVGQRTPYLVPQATPQATPAAVPSPAYVTPPPMLPNATPALVPQKDPARQAMADYIAARQEAAAQAKMQAEMDAQIEKAMAAIAEAGVASPSFAAGLGEPDLPSFAERLKGKLKQPGVDSAKAVDEALEEEMSKKQAAGA